MMRTKLGKLALYALALYPLAWNTGCGGREADLTKPLSLDPPLALKGELVFVDHDNDRAFLLDVTQKQVESAAQVVALPHDPVLVVRRNAADEALVLSLGRRASATEDDEPAELAALSGNGTLRRYKLGNSFDQLSQSEDGRYALMFKSNSSSLRLIGNPNEIAIVDLTKAPKAKDAVTLRTLLSFGESPLSAVFSPQMEIVGEKRRLAIVLSQKNVTLLDLDHLDRLETTVQLSRQGDEAIEPTQIAFNPSAPELYVRGENSSDVFVFNLSPRPGSDADTAGTPAEDGKPHNDFRPFIDQLGVGGRPTDITVYDDGSGPRLLVLTGDTQTASIVETSTREITSVKLPSLAGHALVFQAASPRDSKVSSRALLYADNSASLTFVDLVDIADSGSRNVEQLVLEESVANLIPLADEKRVLLMHPSGALSLVDLAGRTVSPISSDSKLHDASFDATQRTLWVGPADQPRVGWLELDSGDTHELLLDADIETFVPMFDSGQIAIVHPSAVGEVTVLDAVRPSREHAKTVRGFLIAGLLDRGK